jgi:hypothetical protein
MWSYGNLIWINEYLDFVVRVALVCTGIVFIPCKKQSMREILIEMGLHALMLITTLVIGIKPTEWMTVCEMLFFALNCVFSCADITNNNLMLRIVRRLMLIISYVLIGSAYTHILHNHVTTSIDIVNAFIGYTMLIINYNLTITTQVHNRPDNKYKMC